MAPARLVRTATVPGTAPVAVTVTAVTEMEAGAVAVREEVEEGEGVEGEAEEAEKVPEVPEVPAALAVQLGALEVLVEWVDLVQIVIVPGTALEVATETKRGNLNQRRASPAPRRIGRRKLRSVPDSGLYSSGSNTDNFCRAAVLVIGYLFLSLC